MKPTIKRLFIVTLSILSLSGAAFSVPAAAKATQAEANKEAGLNIVASIKPLSLLAKQLAAPSDKVVQLLGADRSPHHYQLKISDRQQLQQADLILWVGPELESFLGKPLGQVKASKTTASQLADINWPAAGHHDHGEEDENEHNHHRDPHLWLDPYNLGVIAQSFSAALIKAAPQNTAVYTAKRDKLLRELAALDKRLQQQLPAIADIPFIVMHPAYGHFVERYALNQQDYIVKTPERGIGAKHLFALKNLSVHCVFGEEGENNKLTTKVASYAKAKLALLDPLGINIADNASATGIIEKLAVSLSDCLASANKKHK